MYPQDDSQKGHCIACGFSFTLFKRKQKCFLCAVGYCDSCSKKKIDIGGREQRCCDCCFNILSHKLDSEREKMFMAGKLTKLPSPTQQQKIDIANKKSLLGDSQVDSTRERPSASAVCKEGGMEALKSHLGEAQDQLRKRGEKLQDLGDKSDRLKNSANEFAKLASQLKKERASSWW